MDTCFSVIAERRRWWTSWSGRSSVGNPTATPKWCTSKSWPTNNSRLSASRLRFTQQSANNSSRCTKPSLLTKISQVSIHLSPLFINYLVLICYLYITYIDTEMCILIQKCVWSMLLFFSIKIFFLICYLLL